MPPTSSGLAGARRSRGCGPRCVGGARRGLSLAAPCPTPPRIRPPRPQANRLLGLILSACSGAGREGPPPRPAASFQKNHGRKAVIKTTGSWTRLGREWRAHPASHASNPVSDSSDSDSDNREGTHSAGGGGAGRRPPLSLSSSPWTQTASTAPAPSGLLSDYDRGPGSGRVSVIP